TAKPSITTQSEGTLVLGQPCGGGWPMRRTLSRAAKKKPHPKTKLGLPDLDQAKAAVLGSLPSPESQRGYQHSIIEFLNWYCSEPRLSFNKTVVTRYRIHLESRSLAPGTINVRLADIRRLAYEAADDGISQSHAEEDHLKATGC